MFRVQKGTTALLLSSNKTPKKSCHIIFKYYLSEV